MKAVAFALLGPTASGKSRLALELAARLPLEIVSVDSAQVYRGMDIGTAKPSAAERAAIPHHLIDIRDPTETYSAGQFRSDCIQVVEEVLHRGRLPLLVGGTMLYYRALASGLDALPPANLEVRAAIDAEAAAKGWPALHAELARSDPKGAARLRPNDAQRIQRAMEVLRVTGRPLSELHTATRRPPPFELAAYALVPDDRAELHRRIASRFNAMLDAGLIDEVKALRKRYRLDAAPASMRAVGYRQVWEHLEGGYDAATLRERGVAATRQLAKRQLTWLRTLEDIERVQPDPVSLARAIERRTASRMR